MRTHLCVGCGAAWAFEDCVAEEGDIGEKGRRLPKFPTAFSSKATLTTAQTSKFNSVINKSDLITFCMKSCWAIVGRKKKMSLPSFQTSLSCMSVLRSSGGHSNHLIHSARSLCILTDPGVGTGYRVTTQGPPSSGGFQGRSLTQSCPSVGRGVPVLHRAVRREILACFVRGGMLFIFLYNGLFEPSSGCKGQSKAQTPSNPFGLLMEIGSLFDCTE